MSIDYTRNKADVLGALREVASLADGAGALSLARGLREDRIPRLEEERFHLVVLGEFNHGKTTFVNALLQNELLPVGVTPTTAMIHRIEHGETPSARAVKESGEGHDVPVGEVEQFVVGGAAAREDVRYLEVMYPSPILEGGVVLVDTPGVNDLNLQRAEITYGYIPRSDAVVFLLDAGQILKESERQFISQKLLSGSKDKLFFVINKVDLLDDDEREEAIAYARTHLSQLVDEPKVFALSAQKAVEGHRDSSGLDDFVTALETFLQEERGRLLLDNALDQGLRTASVLRTGVEVQKRALAMDQADLEARLQALESDLEGSGDRLAQRQQKVRESLAAVKAMVRTDVENFAKTFALALPEEIERSKAEELKKYLPGFIEDKFRQLADQQSEEVARRLERVAEEAIAFMAEDAEEAASRLRQTLGPAGGDLDLKVNTFAYDVGVFALGAFGLTMMALSNVLVGGALALAAPVLAYVFRGRADKEVKRRAMEEAPRVVREAAGKLADAFDDQVDRFGDHLIEYLTQATEEMSRSMAEVLQTVRSARREGEEALSSLQSRTGTTMARLHSVDERMKGLKNALWSNGKGQAAG